MTPTFAACRISSASLDPASAPPTLVWETIDVSDGFTVRYPAWPGDAAELLLGVLREAGARLAEVPAQDLVDCVGRVANRFLDSSDPLRQEAIDLLVPTAGISTEMASEILTGMARDCTAERLTELLWR